MTDGYNGWSNYPTWNVALWLDNEEGTYNESRRMARVAVEDASHYGRTPEGHLADQLQEWVQELNVDAPTTGMTADLYGWAESCINWFEIAEAYLEEVSEDA